MSSQTRNAVLRTYQLHCPFDKIGSKTVCGFSHTWTANSLTIWLKNFFASDKLTGIMKCAWKEKKIANQHDEPQLPEQEHIIRISNWLRQKFSILHKTFAYIFSIIVKNSVNYMHTHEFVKSILVILWLPALFELSCASRTAISHDPGHGNGISRRALCRCRYYLQPIERFWAATANEFLPS